jgi:TolB-like protein
VHERPPSIRTIRPDLDPAIDAALLKALAKSPADRFATPREFIDALDGRSTRQLAPKKHSRRAVIGVGALVVLGVLAVATAVPLTSRHPDARPAVNAAVNAMDPSHIAVLPFETNGVAELAPVASGLSRDLIVALQNVPSLSVVSPEGVQGFAHLRPDSIGRLLKVGTIVSATLERDTDTLELNVRLIQSSSALQRASTRIRTPASHFLRMRDSLVHEVTEQLRQRLGNEIRLSEWRSQTKSDAAWTLRQTADNLLDREATMRRNPASLAPQLSVLARADSTLRAASSADPAWPDPIVERARIRIRLADYFEGAQSLAQIDTGLRIVATALARNPSSAAAMATRGELRYLRVFYGAAGDSATAVLDSARSDLVTATAEDDHLSTGWSALSAVLRLSNDLRGSVEAARQALASDAYLRSVPTATSKLILSLLYSGQTAEARRLCAGAQRQYPTHPEISTCELAILAYTGSTGADARRMWELVAENERAGPWASVNGISPIARYWAAAVIARAGMPESAKAVADRTRRITSESRVADDYWSIEAFARLVAGDTAAAIDILGNAVETRRATPALIASFPEFAALRENARLRARLSTRH